MKTNRIFSVFLLLVLITSLFLTPSAQADETTAAAPPELNSKAVLLVDANTGSVVYAVNEHQELYPASTTKIMTALLVLEAVDRGELSLGDELTASRAAITTGLAEDGSTANIKEGEVMTVEEYLTCMLVVSANEACNVLAEAVSGSVEAFVEDMNERAQQLGCENTHFVNTTGLHDSQHYTSAWDLYLITAEAMKHDAFMRICDTATAVIPATNLSEERTLHTTNYLIGTWWSRGYLYDEAHGIKTGSTSQAGHCLVSSATRGSLSFISVVLGAERLTLEDGEIRTYSFYDTRLLFDWAFDNFSYQTVLTADELIRDVGVALSKTDRVSVHPAEDVELLLPNGTEPADLKRSLELQDPVDAPITEGQALGTMTLSLDGKTLATVDLLAMADVEADGLLVFWRDVQVFFSKTAVRVVCIVLGVLIVALVIWRLTVGRRRYRYGRSVGRRGRGGGYRGRRR